MISIALWTLVIFGLANLIAGPIKRTPEEMPTEDTNAKNIAVTIAGAFCLILGLAALAQQHGWLR